MLVPATFWNPFNLLTWTKCDRKWFSISHIILKKFFIFNIRSKCKSLINGWHEKKKKSEQKQESQKWLCRMFGTKNVKFATFWTTLDGCSIFSRNGMNKIATFASEILILILFERLMFDVMHTFLWLTDQFPTTFIKYRRSTKYEVHTNERKKAVNRIEKCLHTQSMQCND